MACLSWGVSLPEKYSGSQTSCRRFSKLDTGFPDWRRRKIRLLRAIEMGVTRAGGGAGSTLRPEGLQVSLAWWAGGLEPQEAMQSNSLRLQLT
jgi:hypothetical protein